MNRRVLIAASEAPQPPPARQKNHRRSQHRRSGHERQFQPASFVQPGREPIRPAPIAHESQVTHHRHEGHRQQQQAAQPDARGNSRPPPFHSQISERAQERKRRWFQTGLQKTSQFPRDEKSRLLKLKIEEILGAHLASERPTQTV